MTQTHQELREEFENWYRTSSDVGSKPVTDWWLKKLEDQKQRVIEIAQNLKKDTHPTEDGVPVETYGYEETHNQALDELLTKLKKEL